MVVTITYLRLRKLTDFFKLSWFGLRITLQARKFKGLVAMKNTGFGYYHYTMSLWKTEHDAKLFAKSGAHLEAMKQAEKFASQVKIFTYDGNLLPSWREAKTLILEKGREINYK